jgi:7-cyano-7-deazaguanine synthase
MNLETIRKDLPVYNCQKVVSVLSGGLDSTVLTYLLAHHFGAESVYAISFNYGQKQKIEIDRARLTCMNLKVRHKILDLSVLGEIAKPMSANISDSAIKMPTIKDVLGDPQPKTYVPFRNMILLSLALSYAESVDAEFVFSGLQATDQYNYWDTTQMFVDQMNLVATQNRTHRIQIRTPFSKLSKYDELMIAKDLGNVKFEHTLTCYNPSKDGESCGVCPSCSERLKAFHDARMIDPLNYVGGR